MNESTHIGLPDGGLLISNSAALDLLVRVRIRFLFRTSTGGILMIKQLLLPVAFFAAACGSSSSSSSTSSIYNTWFYGTSTLARGLTLKKDNTYLYEVIQITSNTTANTQAESGDVAITTSTLKFSPQKWTCAGPDASTTATYSLSGNSLEVGFDTGAIAFVLDTAAASTNVSLTYGCFDSTGNFTPHAFGMGEP